MNVAADCTSDVPVPMATAATVSFVNMPTQYGTLASNPMGLTNDDVAAVPAAVSASMAPVARSWNGTPALSSYNRAANRAVVLVPAGMNVMSFSSSAASGTIRKRVRVLPGMLPPPVFTVVELPKTTSSPPPVTTTPGVQPGAGTPRNHSGSCATMRA